MVSLLFFGDIVGNPGRQALTAHLPALRERFKPDLVIANGENAAGGLGIDPGTADEIFAAGVEVITSGNHIWQKKDVYNYLAKNPKIIRPINFAPGAPGRGTYIAETSSGIRVGVLNAIGRVFMPQLVDCPFRTVATALESDFADVPVRVIDFHAEATSEKLALAHHFDGKASLIVGTHTHVQTADERIFSGGTAVITDVGMCGPLEGVIGVSAPLVVEKFVTGLPGKFDVAKGPKQICAVYVEVDEKSGKALKIERILDIVD